ncbi:MAG: methionyl-tRNA formyltransferase [Betaproteobacteria bacterium]
MGNHELRIAFAGDRDIAVTVLAHLLELGDRPAALILPDEGRATDDAALVGLCENAGLFPLVVRAGHLDRTAAVEALRALRLDFLICVHFPFLIRGPVLEAAAKGVLNLHPAYLPFNRGWHTPSWAILDGTPAGATLHFMTEGLDNGDVVYQEQIAVDPADTAHTLYSKLKALELRVFAEGWRRIREGRIDRTAQPEPQATFHRRRDLFEPAVQRIDLDGLVRASDLLRRLRALTTSRVNEAAYFEANDRRYRVQVTITPEGEA